MIRLLTLFLLAGVSVAASDVEVEVLGLFQPETLIVEQARGQSVTIAAPKAPFEYRGEFALVVPGRFRRSYQGALRIGTAEGRLRAVVAMSEREYLARVAAAEMNEAPPAALRAQVIAARSYLHAAGRRHSSAQVCDTTHCQWTADRPPRDHPAWAAVDATEGVVLRVDGRVLEALYSRRCGGTTRSSQYSGADDRYRAVRCPACAGEPAEAEGHRTGLCQRGALLLGLQGATAAEILRVYFPHAELWAGR